MRRYSVIDPPDPGAASTPADFVGALRQLRLWAGQPSLRRIRQLGGTMPGEDGVPVDVLPESTTSYTLRGMRFPRAEFVRAFVAACLRSRDRSPDEVAEWVERWHDAWLFVVSGGPLSNRWAYRGNRRPVDAVEPA